MTDPLNPGFTLPEDAPATPAAPPQAPAATPPMPDVVPTTIPAALRVAVQWLNGYDEWVRQVLVQAGADEDARAIAQGDEVQRFLESLAVWFDARPQLAELARGQVDL